MIMISMLFIGLSIFLIVVTEAIEDKVLPILILAFIASIVLPTLFLIFIPKKSANTIAEEYNNLTEEEK